jgi:DNA-binding response OmpR family regulator
LVDQADWRSIAWFFDGDGPMRILLVEDEFLLAAALARGLENHGFVVDVAADGESALAKLDADAFDIVVLDRRLPHIGGDEVCSELRTRGIETPILMLTAANELEDRIAGLELGADDYLGKPAALAELVARIEALGRRRARTFESLPAWREISLVRSRRAVRRSDREVALTAKEFAVLEELVLAEGDAVSLDVLAKRLWGPGHVLANTVRATVMRLRKKLGQPDCIETVTGLGYRLK